MNLNPIDFLVDRLMLPILDSFHNVTGSYGWAIIFLTFLIKMVLLPLTMQSYYSMKEMQKLQPKLKRIQERYKGKPEELNKQIMMLYRNHRVNPLGGCLPMLVQMPFLIALYASLIGEKFGQALKASGDTTFFLIEDLSRVGVYTNGTIYWDNLSMVVLFGATTFWQQKIMTPTGPQDPTAQAMQKQMQVMMPIMITGMFLFFPVPSGVFLYIVASNLISIAQYTYLNYQSKQLDAKAASKPSADDTLMVDAEELDDEPEAIALGASADHRSGTDKYQVKKPARKKKKRK
jgi:YidC/Oxa1 family membrane protein insertase